MSKKIKYTSVKQDETIDISLAFGQASALLDQAAKKAIREDDSEMLIAVADRWITIGSLLSTEEETTIEHLDTNQKSMFGFGPREEGVDDEDE